MTNRAVSLALLVLALIWTMPAARAGVFRLPADATAYVDDSNPARTHYEDGDLRAEHRWEVTQSYLRFFTGYVTGKPVTAKLTLTTDHWGHNGDSETFHVYGLKDGSPGDQRDGWDEAMIDAQNAPGNATPYGVDPKLTVDLGDWSVPAVKDQSSTPVTFASAALANFIRADTNGYITLIVSAATTDDGNSCFFSRYSAPDVQPVLEVDTDSSDGADLTRNTLRLDGHARQTLFDYGVGNGGANGPGQNFGALTDEQKQIVSAELFKNSNRHTLRVWCFPADGDVFRQDGTVDLSEFKKSYVDCGVIQYARANGMTTLLLCPGVPPVWMDTKETYADAANQPILKPGMPEKYGDQIAEFAYQVKQQFGITIDNCAIANECCQVDVDQWPAVVKALRAGLDKRGLTATKISADDWPNNDGWMTARIQAIKNDPEAWKDLDVVSAHSYAMCETDAIYQTYVKGQNKQYWCTETECSGPTQAAYGADLCNHLLSDIENGCSDWVYHESVLGDNPGNGSLLISIYPYDKTKPSWIEIPPRELYFKQVGLAIEPGASIREVRFNNGLLMCWAGAPTNLMAAGGLNADGTYAMAIVNTGSKGDAPVTVQIAIDGLARVPEATLKAVRSTSAGCLVSEAPVILHHGVATVTVGQYDLLTLRAATAK